MIDVGAVQVRDPGHVELLGQRFQHLFFPQYAQVQQHFSQPTTLLLLVGERFLKLQLREVKLFPENFSPRRGRVTLILGRWGSSCSDTCSLTSYS